MSTAESIAFDKSDSTDEAAAYSTDVVPCRRTNIHMVQNVLLIWLDNKIDDKSDDCRNTVTQLKRTVNAINTFTDGDQCIQFIESINSEKACMIISGALGQNIVPRVHNMSQVDSIFIFCGNKKRHEEWTKEYSKIKGVFTDITLICEALKKAAQQCEQNAIPMSFVPTNDDAFNKNMDQLDVSFMYTQILKEILLTITFDQKHIKEFTDHCRELFVNNDYELNNVDIFERQYHDKTPIWWYTYECFLYPMLNCALRVMDVDTIIKMGFFIDDLHRHIEQLHKEQFGNDQSRRNFTVYRGQGMSKTGFDQMKKTKGGLLSFNNFLSTSKDRKVALVFTHRAATNPDLVGILFVMTIDSSQTTTPFASVIGVGCYGTAEDEVLFSMHTVFRIHNIKSIGENDRLFQVDLTLTNENDKDLRRLTDHIRKETFPEHEGWFRLGHLLRKMGQPDKAQQLYEVLLGQTTGERKKSAIYHQLGVVKYDQKEYMEAVIFYGKALEIDKTIYPSNHPCLAGMYNNIAVAFENMKEYSKALLIYEKALKIQQQSRPPDHLDLAISYYNIGSLYGRIGKYAKAVPYLEKDLEISLKALPSNHPNLAISYHCIGLLHEKMGNYSKAHSLYERAVDIAQRTLPPNHPHLQNYRLSLEHVKKKL